MNAKKQFSRFNKANKSFDVGSNTDTATNSCKVFVQLYKGDDDETKALYFPFFVRLKNS